MLTPKILSGLFGQPRSEGAILVGEPLFFQDFLREFLCAVASKQSF